MKNFIKFSNKTSLHGWSYFGDAEGNLLQKLFWFIVLFSSILFSGYLIRNSTIGFLTTFTVINVVDRTGDGLGIFGNGKIDHKLN